MIVSPKCTIKHLLIGAEPAGELTDVPKPPSWIYRVGPGWERKGRRREMGEGKEGRAELQGRKVTPHFCKQIAATDYAIGSAASIVSQTCDDLCSPLVSVWHL